MRNLSFGLCILNKAIVIMGKFSIFVYSVSSIGKAKNSLSFLELSRRGFTIEGTMSLFANQFDNVSCTPYEKKLLLHICLWFFMLFPRRSFCRNLQFLG